MNARSIAVRILLSLVVNLSLSVLSVLFTFAYW